MAQSLVNAAEIDPADLAELTNRAFDGYIGGQIQWAVPSFLNYVAGEGINLNLSRVAQRDGAHVGLALVARLGWTSRLALMGIVPEAAGQGVGKWFMGELIKEARERNDRRYVLEVIEQNEPGVRLYKGCGFLQVRRLCGYALQSPQADIITDLEMVNPYDVGRMLAFYDADDLPWQAAGPEVMRLGPPNEAYRLDDAYAVLVQTPDAIVLRSLFVPPEYRKQGRATRLMQALFSKFNHRRWRIPAICPETIGDGFFAPLGFEKETISQFQMALDL
jgi:GNAT superfamily N-acetyltransferase